MANVTPIRAVKAAFSTQLALTAALQMSRSEQTKMTVALVAALTLRTDDRGIVRVRYDELARSLNVARRTVEIRFPALLEAGALDRPDPRMPWEYRWNVERLTELSALEGRAANDSPVSDRPERAVNALSLGVDHRNTLAAVRDGFKREHAKQTLAREGAAVLWAPPLPGPEKCHEIVAAVDQLAAELEHHASEVGRYVGLSYRRYETGLAAEKRWPLEWLPRSNVAFEGAARLLTRAAAKHRSKSRARSASPAMQVDPAANAARAAEIARAVGGAR